MNEEPSLLAAVFRAACWLFFAWLLRRTGAERSLVVLCVFGAALMFFFELFPEPISQGVGVAVVVLLLVGFIRAWKQRRANLKRLRKRSVDQPDQAR
jgi:hypothetical protein